MAAGAHGLVCGYLDDEGKLDEVALALVQGTAGAGVGLTFHRAFDRLADREAALPRLATYGVERILTSGGAATAWEGRAVLRVAGADRGAVWAGDYGGFGNDAGECR